MKKFTIDEQFITSVHVYEQWNMYTNKPEISADDLVEVLRGKGNCSSSSFKDHPEFNKLREQLSEEGYIDIQRGWWNGDVVKKPFFLNEYKFIKGEQFPSGAAMMGHLRYMKKAW